MLHAETVCKCDALKLESLSLRCSLTCINSNMIGQLLETISNCYKKRYNGISVYVAMSLLVLVNIILHLLVLGRSALAAFEAKNLFSSPQAQHTFTKNFWPLISKFANNIHLKSMQFV